MRRSRLLLGCFLVISIDLEELNFNDHPKICSISIQIIFKKTNNFDARFCFDQNTFLCWNVWRLGRCCWWDRVRTQFASWTTRWLVCRRCRQQVWIDLCAKMIPYICVHKSATKIGKRKVIKSFWTSVGIFHACTKPKLIKDICHALFCWTLVIDWNWLDYTRLFNDYCSHKFLNS